MNLKIFFRIVWIVAFIITVGDSTGNSLLINNRVPSEKPDNGTAVKKVKDMVLYRDTMFYPAFPSIARNAKGEFLLAFRRSPDRKTMMGYKGRYHVDPNSYLMLLRSDNGEEWTKEPELLYAHPFGGSQDPCLLTLKDGTMLCTSFSWTFIQPEGITNLKQPFCSNVDGGILFGGYLVRSEDDGKTWQGPIYPPSISQYYNPIGQHITAFNRAGFCEGKDGRIYWAVTGNNPNKPNEAHLLVSNDKGLTWEHACTIATDKKVSFGENTIYETPNGDLVAFMRTGHNNDHSCIARSTDKGKSFGKWQDMGFQGHPMHVLRLDDNRVLLTYGYRHEPFGIRARILNPECTDYETAPEIILREDGGNQDLGYPWSIQLDSNRVLVVYYFNDSNDTRYIAGTILEIGKK